TGIVPMTEPTTRLTLEAPGGLVEVVADCRDGKVERVTLTNVPSFVDRCDAALEVEGLGTLRVDTAYGGDSFVMVDAADLGFAIAPDEASDLVRAGVRITRAANEQLGFTHPENDEWRHVSFCQIAGAIERDATSGALAMRNTVVIEPGKLDRSPTGTGVSARMALLRASGRMEVGDELVVRSVIDSSFTGRIVADAMVAGTPAIVPSVSGRAWITGTHEHTLDPADPWPRGYRVADTWPSRDRTR
ncbi:MAG: proline racemase family protein, partial [Planctomycetota bacterium]